MIAPKCEMCSCELIDFGGLLLSPPDDSSRVVKDHLCKSCYAVLWDFIAKYQDSHHAN